MNLPIQSHDPIIPKYIWIMVQGELRRRAEHNIHNVKNIRVEYGKCGEHYREVDELWRPYHAKGCCVRRVQSVDVLLAIKGALADLKAESISTEQHRLHTAIAGIDEMLRISDEQQTMMEEAGEQGDHANRFKEQRIGLYSERAELALREMHAFVLLDFIERSPCSPASPCSQGMEDEDSGDNGGPCSDVDDFFKRTSHTMKGEDLIEKVLVGDDGELTVVFNAGVEWKEPVSSSTEG